MYAKVENGAVTSYPYTISELRRDNPTVSFPNDSFFREDVVNKYGIVNIVSVNQPDSLGHHVREGNPEFVDGVWVQTWNKILKEPSEVSEDEKVGYEVQRSDYVAPHFSGAAIEMPKEDGKIAVEVDPVWDGTQWNRTYSMHDIPAEYWRDARMRAYGTVEKQIEFITENGLEAWQAKVSEIKIKFPKI